MSRRQYGFLVQYTQATDGSTTHRLDATIVYPNPSGGLLHPVDLSPTAFPYLTDYQVSGYLSHDEECAWGYCHGYSNPYLVDRPAAEAMLRTLRKIDNGLDKATERQGHVKDFDEYLFRIARNLNAQTYYVRNTPERLNVTGERFHRLDAPGIQSWIRDLEATLARNSQ